MQDGHILNALSQLGPLPTSVLPPPPAASAMPPMQPVAAPGGLPTMPGMMQGMTLPQGVALPPGLTLPPGLSMMMPGLGAGPGLPAGTPPGLGLPGTATGLAGTAPGLGLPGTATGLMLPTQLKGAPGLLPPGAAAPGGFMLQGLPPGFVLPTAGAVRPRPPGPAEKRPKGDGPPGRRKDVWPVFVGNISFDTTEKDVGDLFNGVEGLVSWRLSTQGGGSRGFGFAEFLTAEGALQAIKQVDGTEIKGRKLRLRWGENSKTTPAVDEFHKAPERYKTRPCYEAYNGQACPRGDDCPYAHTKEEIRRFPDLRNDPDESKSEKPVDPKDLVTKVLVPFANFPGDTPEAKQRAAYTVILGPGASNIRAIMKKAGCKLQLRGEGAPASAEKEPLHLVLKPGAEDKAVTQEQLEMVRRAVDDIVETGKLPDMGPPPASATKPSSEAGEKAASSQAAAEAPAAPVPKPRPAGPLTPGPVNQAASSSTSSDAAAAPTGTTAPIPAASSGSQPAAAASSSSSATADTAAVNTGQGEGGDRPLAPGAVSSASPDLPRIPGLQPAPSASAKLQYFVVRSHTLLNIQTSIREGVWATSRFNTQVLQEAFQSCDHVVLIFSANHTGQFQGYCRMTSAPDRKLGQGLWGKMAGRLGDTFKVEWLKQCVLPFSETDNLRNDLNSGCPLRKSRDGQEVPAELGAELCRLLYQQRDEELLKLPSGEPADEDGEAKAASRSRSPRRRGSSPSRRRSASRRRSPPRRRSRSRHQRRRGRSREASRSPEGPAWARKPTGWVNPGGPPPAWSVPPGGSPWSTPPPGFGMPPAPGPGMMPPGYGGPPPPGHPGWGYGFPPPPVMGGFPPPGPGPGGPPPPGAGPPPHGLGYPCGGPPMPEAAPPPRPPAGWFGPPGPPPPG